MLQVEWIVIVKRVEWGRGNSVKVDIRFLTWKIGNMGLLLFAKIEKMVKKGGGRVGSLEKIKNSIVAR